MLHGDLDEALGVVRESIKFDPKYAIAHATLAEILTAKNELDGVVAAGREAVRLDPKMPEIRQILETALKLKSERDMKIGRIAPPPREVNR